MTRDAALEELKKPAYDPEQVEHDKEYIANKLRIPISELEEYFEMPKKTFKDYKSMESIYNIGANIMRVMGFERGGKR
jgi:hypothetical protein